MKPTFKRAGAAMAGPVITTIGLLAATGSVAESSLPNTFVRVSPRDPRYFELSDGRPYIPIGLNMISPPAKESFPVMEAWMKDLAANGGNFIRVWTSSWYFDVEHAHSGQYDEERAKRIEELLTNAARHGIRVKLCLEHFRHLGEGRQGSTEKRLHLVANGGTATNIADFFDGTASREQFKRKIEWFAKRFGNHPAIFGWELWNEVNTVEGGDYLAWTEAMLPELHRCFPRHLAMQSLGSFDSENSRAAYYRLATMPGNDVAQVHRYLDLGANFPVCKGPVHILAADAVHELLGQKTGRPVLLAESGAVEPKHSGPSTLYSRDTEGVILHDVLFAPFFSGAAGPGHVWHWDKYVATNNLWHHFGRFAGAIKDIDPPAEHFAPLLLPDSRLGVYVLKGRHRSLLWCRDRDTTWQTELVEGKSAQLVQGAVLDVSAIDAGLTNASLFDPWENRWNTATVRNGKLSLPPFKRSIVVHLTRSPRRSEP